MLQVIAPSEEDCTYFRLDNSDGIPHWDRMRSTFLEKADVQFKLGILLVGQIKTYG